MSLPADVTSPAISQLKALKLGTPYQAIGELWKSKPEAFIVQPNHHMPGPNT
jgi:hypothetical protein